MKHVYGVFNFVGGISPTPLNHHTRAPLTNNIYIFAKNNLEVIKTLFLQCEVSLYEEETLKTTIKPTISNTWSCGWKTFDLLGTINDIDEKL